jgi:hypothetical protein
MEETMRKTGLLWLVVMTFAIPASAQNKVGGKAHCDKADPMYSIEVGDRAGHLLIAQKSACTWSESLPIAGLATKTGFDIETGEVSGATAHSTGYHTATVDNGDKYTVRYTGVGTMGKDNSGAGEGKWTFVSGTGKLKGIKGGGTYKATINADGSSDVTVDGEYTLPAPKPTTSTGKK